MESQCVETSGLGGKGGPYRLDAGHQVHQLSKVRLQGFVSIVWIALFALNMQA